MCSCCKSAVDSWWLSGKLESCQAIGDAEVSQNVFLADLCELALKIYISELLYKKYLAIFTYVKMQTWRQHETTDVLKTFDKQSAKWIWETACRQQVALTFI